MSYEDEKRSIDLETHLKEPVGDFRELGDINVSFFCSSRSQTCWLTTPGRTQRLAIDDFDDPNLDPTAIELEDESPYPEVRSAVANTDDPTIPVSTLRAWVIGLLWAIIIPGVNQFFFFRYPSVTISSVCLSAVKKIWPPSY
jgi:hypothetical protein